MVNPKIYKCKRCDKLFDHKGDYLKHLNRKTPCKKFPEKHDKLKITFTINDDGRFECPKCNKSFITKGNLKRHYYDLCGLETDTPISNDHRFDDLKSNIRVNSVDQKCILNDNLDDLDDTSSIHSNNDKLSLGGPNLSSTTILEQLKQMINAYQTTQKPNFPKTDVFITDTRYDDLDDVQDDDSTITDSKNNINSLVLRCPNNVPQNIEETLIESHYTNLTCSYCNKEFSRKDNLIRHQKNGCRQKNKQDKEKPLLNLQEENLAKDKAYAALREEIEQMKLLIEALQAEKTNNTVNAKNINSNNNTTIQTINNNNDIKVIAFGTEDLYSILDDNQAMKYLSKGYQAVYSLIEDMHFDPKKPEFHSVYISDKNRPNALQFNGDNWDTVEKDDVVDQLFDDKACYLNAMFKELKNKLNSKTIIKYSRFMNDTDKEVIESIKRDIKKLLYNKRHIPMATKKMLGL